MKEAGSAEARKAGRKEKTQGLGLPWTKRAQLTAVPPSNPHDPTSHLPENCPLSRHPGAHQLCRWRGTGCQSRLRGGVAPEDPPPRRLPWARGGDSLSGSPAASAPRGRAPLCGELTCGRGGGGPRPTELPKTPGDSSPGTLPLWGGSFSPPLGPDPGGLSHTSYARTSLGHLLRSPGAREPGAPSARRCVHPGPHGAASQQCQLRERWVRAGVGVRRGGTGIQGTALLPFLILLSFESSPARLPKTEGRGVSTSCPPPSPQAYLGKEQGSG